MNIPECLCAPWYLFTKSRTCDRKCTSVVTLLRHVGAITSRHKNVRQAMPTPMVFRNHINPLEGFSDTELISRYQFPRHGILELLDLVEKDMRRPTGRTYAIPAVTRLVNQKKESRLYSTRISIPIRNRNIRIHTKHTCNNIMIRTFHPLV